MLELRLETFLEGGTKSQDATLVKAGAAALDCKSLIVLSKNLCIDEATASIDHETERANCNCTFIVL
ncbi:hypothetical protein CCR75_003369 [Bremia lactucae]|uniref:Uncharacterized protein n=1 Tax=Bremia lactucae TaxID=4779 RepID=A0A976FI45_BRELC|nr:hypothetical protein CCR75_003369 [Bremia lactucae]